MTEELLKAESCFVLRAEDRADMFAQVYKKLLEQGLVAAGFLDQVVDREEDFPTGLASCNLAPVSFKSMVDPSRELPVGFCFMLLDQKADGQAELLARTMTFLSQAEPADLSRIFAQTDPAGLYSALREEGF
ncbi:PTS sugar transporter subunit IIA [Lactobacillus delbrueckii]|uniref:PTS sugar transporter subunit IIA n=1 Tax=Lactobacillus delbrueckii TaxID=1584 RepID=A0ABD4W267_9LACO|nr:PTS sugar transporter subunit IIA [Lactobacillus delbrueckii]MDA3777810.1 PTS sugar transporter subunit IIA [Lactobacillus delbrueckii]MDA3782698.1 PTS sugar transporter subunit IIA [Lactobacillus delbrueckii]MDA3794631.1 PTS sugar transporter subunit IIA [Lactobacillus delbrueckii]MDA3841910.1 PTS sugar transporter subunit IIA [Lactobacillus delbrueckii]